MSDENNKMRSGYREAYGYLSTGGLPEVLALADVALRGGAPKVQLDTEMALVLCHLAADGLVRRDETGNHGSRQHSTSQLSATLVGAPLAGAGSEEDRQPPTPEAS